jgi:hypothetical protein
MKLAALQSDWLSYLWKQIQSDPKLRVATRTVAAQAVKILHYKRVY